MSKMKEYAPDIIAKLDQNLTDLLEVIIKYEAKIAMERDERVKKTLTGIVNTLKSEYKEVVELRKLYENAN